MTICFRLAVFIIPAFLAFNTGFTAKAEDGNEFEQYQSPEERLEMLINDLDQFIDAGIRSGHAQPGFLEDLNAIVARYRTPKKQIFFSDNFADNNFSENPVWTVKEGSFRINSHGSLYSAIAIRKPAPEEEREFESEDDRNLRILFGVINKLAIDENGDAEEESRIPSRAIISSLAPIANGFIMDFTLRSNSEWGSTSIGVIQGDDPRSGYHLVYRASPAENRPMQLIKYRNGKPYVIEEVIENSPDLDDGAEHKIRFIHRADGKMLVMVDNTEMMRATDLSYLNDFNGLAITNDGGSYSYDNIEVFIRQKP